MAERLAELGANVAIHDMDEAAPAKYGEFANLGEVVERLKRHGTKVTSVTGNIGDQNVLVNCAGGDIGAKGGKPNPNNALDIELDDIRVLTENNLIGTMLVCQAFVPPMKQRGSGSVINIASAA